MKHWGNSFLHINIKFLSCDYCGRVVKDATWFTIRKTNGNVFILCDQTCESIWDKKHTPHPD